MFLLRGNTDDLEVITGSAASIRTEMSLMLVDNATPPVVQPIPNFGPLAVISTATTTQQVDTSGLTSGWAYNIKGATWYNDHASQATTFKIQVNDGSNIGVKWNGTLLPGEWVVLTQMGVFLHFDNNGGLYPPKASAVLFNASVTSQGAGFSTDTYLTGSFIKFAGPPKVGTKYKCRFYASKTAAGTASATITVRTGSAGTTSDTSRGALTLSAGTAATDQGWFEVSVLFRTVGSGSAAVTVATLALTSQPTTGFSSLLHAANAVSAGWDSTTADLGIGISVNGGASASWTVQQVMSEIENN
jgi:hypothetical protein